MFPDDLIVCVPLLVVKFNIFNGVSGNALSEVVPDGNLRRIRIR